MRFLECPILSKNPRSTLHSQHGSYLPPYSVHVHTRFSSNDGFPAECWEDPHQPKAVSILSICTLPKRPKELKNPMGKKS